MTPLNNSPQNGRGTNQELTRRIEYHQEAKASSENDKNVPSHARKQKIENATKNLQIVIEQNDRLLSQLTQTTPKSCVSPSSGRPRCRVTPIRSRHSPRPSSCSPLTQQHVGLAPLSRRHSPRHSSCSPVTQQHVGLAPLSRRHSPRPSSRSPVNQQHVAPLANTRSIVTLYNGKVVATVEREDVVDNIKNEPKSFTLTRRRPHRRMHITRRARIGSSSHVSVENVHPVRRWKRDNNLQTIDELIEIGVFIPVVFAKSHDNQRRRKHKRRKSSNCVSKSETCRVEILGSGLGLGSTEMTRGQHNKISSRECPSSNGRRHYLINIRQDVDAFETLADL